MIKLSLIFKIPLIINLLFLISSIFVYIFKIFDSFNLLIALSIFNILSFILNIYLIEKPFSNFIKDSRHKFFDNKFLVGRY
jgi:uncharacterized membrane protein